MAYTIEDYKRAIAAIESSEYKNPYGGKGVWVYRKDGTRDRAYGKYQIMGANIPSWTRRWLGRSMTPQQFLADPDAQEKVFAGQFGSYVQKYGPQGAAQAWIGGPGRVGTVGEGPKDPLGTSVGEYTRRFNKELGRPATPAASMPVAAAPAPAVPSPGPMPIQALARNPAFDSVIQNNAAVTPQQQGTLVTKLASMLGFKPKDAPLAAASTAPQQSAPSPVDFNQAAPVPFAPMPVMPRRQVPLGFRPLQRRQPMAPYRFARGF